MPNPTISGLTVTIPAGSYTISGTGGRGAVAFPVPAGSVTLAAPTSGTETKRIPWKQGTAGDLFANINRLSFVGRTAISNASAVLVGGAAVPSGNVKTHVRGKIYTDLVVADPLQQADVTYNYIRERTDLIECDGVSLYVVQGGESDFHSPTLRPAPTPGRRPLFWAHIWNGAVELVPASNWAGTSSANPVTAARIARHKTRNRAILSAVMAAIEGGTPVTVQFYGDSITAHGGGWAATGGSDDTTYMQSAAGGKARDSAGYLEYRTTALDAVWGPYPTGWSGANDDGTATHSINGWTRRLCVALGAHVTRQNWGIGASNSGTGTAATGAPNGSDSVRLASINAAPADLVFVGFGMNDFVGFATGGLRGHLRNIVSSLQSAQPGRKIVLHGPPGINTENPNSNSSTYQWWLQCHATYFSVAAGMGCAYVPFDLIFHGDLGYCGISPAYLSGANRYNHPTPLELTLMADFVRAVL